MKKKILVGKKLLRDINKRMESGKKTYGTYLYTHNNRDAIQDLYEELIDACFYIKQFMLERDTHEKQHSTSKRVKTNRKRKTSNEK
jgi:hypothetical protein